jgi:lipopolysaccharide export system permease protein
MKKIIFKKILTEILIFFLIFSSALTLIVWVIQAVNYLDIVTEDGHSFDVYFNYTALSLPKLFSQTLPFVFFLSVFYIINNFETNNQLLIYWTHGISKKEFINKILVFSLLFLIIQIFLTTLLVPHTNNKSRSFIRSSNLDFFPNLIKPKKFIDAVTGLTIFIDSKDKNGDYQNIILKDSSASTTQIIIAQSGKIILREDKKFLLLYTGQIIRKNIKNNITIFNFEETQFDLSKYSSKTTKKPKIQELVTTKLIKCTLFLFKNPERKLQMKNMICEKSFLDNLIQELFKRVYMPIYIVLISLAASLLVLKSKNTHNYSIFKVIIFLIGIFLLVISEILLNFTGINHLYNFLFLFFPIVLFLIIYQYMSIKVKSN